jgi:hypothetical protein
MPRIGRRRPEQPSTSGWTYPRVTAVSTSRTELVVAIYGDREGAFRLSLLGVEQKILGVETRAAERTALSHASVLRDIHTTTHRMKQVLWPVSPERDWTSPVKVIDR